MRTLKTELEGPPTTVAGLQAENEELRRRLEEAEETIAAIRSGAVDALVVEESTGHRIYTLQSADRPYRLFVEEMQQGAATLHADGTIAWCNRQLAKLLKTPHEKLIGSALHDFVSPESRIVYQNLLWQGQTRSGRGDMHLLRQDGGRVPAFLTFNALPKDCGSGIGVLVTDLTTQRHHEQLAAAHAALHESERRFREMINALPVAIYTTDAEGRLTHFNPAAVEFSGRTPELGTDQWCVSFKLFYSDGSPMPHDQCPMAIALKEGRVVHGAEAIAERPDGLRRWFTPFPTPLRDRAGKIVGGINMLLDITERKQAEENLRRAAEFDEAVMTNMAEGLYTVDNQGRVTSMNPAAERLFGWALDELRGRVMHEMTHHHHLDGTPFPAEECAGFRVLQEGESLTGHEDVFIRKDGTFFPVIYSSSPIREGNKTVGLVVVFRDVTESKQAEEAKARLAAIVESSADAIISKDLSGVITSWNAGAERLFGYTASEMIGQTVTMLIPPDHFDEEPSILARIRRGERIEHYETVRRRKDGTLLDVSLTVSPVMDRHGRVIGASKIARDTTERKRAEEALRQAQGQLANRAVQLEQAVAERTAKLQEIIGELEGFSYSITHDLRAPLRAMQGLAHLLEEDCGKTLDETGRDYLRRISSSASRMDKLILDVLMYSHVLRKDLPLETVDVNKLLQGMLDSYLEFQEPKTKVTVVHELPAVMANEAALTQCFSNLLNNAVKFVPPGRKPQVRISAERRGPMVRFWVADNGVGIAERHLNRIFDLFQRLDPVYEGTGIGLTIARKAVERMGGKVGVESVPGKGSRFWLDLNPAQQGA